MVSGGSRYLRRSASLGPGSPACPGLAAQVFVIGAVLAALLAGGLHEAVRRMSQQPVMDAAANGKCGLSHGFFVSLSWARRASVEFKPRRSERMSSRARGSKRSGFLVAPGGREWVATGDSSRIQDCSDGIFPVQRIPASTVSPGDQRRPNWRPNGRPPDLSARLADGFGVGSRLRVKTRFTPKRMGSPLQPHTGFDSISIANFSFEVHHNCFVQCFTIGLKQ